MKRKEFKDLEYKGKASYHRDVQTEKISHLQYQVSLQSKSIRALIERNLELQSTLKHLNHLRYS